MKASSESSKTSTYFLTDRWMRHENNVIKSYQTTIERYGEKRADRINKLMLKNYKRFGLVKTGCYDLSQAAQRVKPLADKMEMSIEAIASDRTWLELLVTGPHDDPSLFLTLPPNSKLDFDNWCALLMGESSRPSTSLVAEQLSEADLLKREP
jgi:hypothetical protein